MSVVVRRAAAPDAASIGEIFAAAFAQDPVTSWVTPDAVRRDRLLRRLNEAIARYEAIPRGSAYIAEVNGQPVGAAIWQAPRPHLPNWRSVPFSLAAGRALGRDIPRMMAMGRSVFRARPREPHWYLQLLGVDPGAQRLGVGSLLVRAQLPIVDEHRMPAYLETTVENLEFYGRLGFDVRAEIVIHATAPSEYSLYRPAH